MNGRTDVLWNRFLWRFFTSLFTTTSPSDFSEIFNVISNKLETDMIRDFYAWVVKKALD